MQTRCGSETETHVHQAMGLEKVVELPYSMRLHNYLEEHKITSHCETLGKEVYNTDTSGETLFGISRPLRPCSIIYFLPHVTCRDAPPFQSCTRLAATKLIVDLSVPTNPAARDWMTISNKDGYLEREECRKVTSTP